MLKAADDKNFCRPFLIADMTDIDYLCGLVVTVPGYRSRGLGLFPGATRLSEKLEVVGLEWGPLSLMSTIEELLERKSSGCSLEKRDYGCRDPPRYTPLSTKMGTNFADKLRVLSQYSSLVD
jgi:hypothetical protein